MSSITEARTALAAAYWAAIDLDLHLAWRQLQQVQPRGLSLRYRPDQPRAPRGTGAGGQWIEDLSNQGRRAAQTTEPRIRRSFWRVLGRAATDFQRAARMEGLLGLRPLFSFRLAEGCVGTAP